MTNPRRNAAHARSDDSEADVDGLTQIENRSWYGGTRTEPLVIEDEDDFDVFGTVQEAEGSHSAQARTSAKANGTWKGKQVAGSSSQGRQTQGSHLSIRNDMPLVDPVASDTDMDYASPLPPPSSLKRRRMVEHILSIEIPHVPQEELDQYIYMGLAEEAPLPRVILRPSKIPLPPTPPTTVAGQYSARPISSTSASEAGAAGYDHSSPYGERPDNEDEHMNYDSQLPSPSQSPPGMSSRRMRDRSSTDPLIHDWSSRAGASEGAEGDIDFGNGADAEDEDEESYEDEEVERHSPAKRKLRGFDERREASKLAMKQRLRGNLPRVTLRVSVPDPIPSPISVSSGAESAMPAARRLLKRKFDAQKAKAVISVDSDSPYNDEGEEEIDQVASSDFDDDWGVRPVKGKGKARRKGKGGKKGRRRVMSESSDSPDEDDILMQHREFCEKCRRGPAAELLAAALAKKKRRGKKQKKDDDEVSEDEVAESLQGWLECRSCVASWHWGCLGVTDQREALAFLECREGPPAPDAKKRKEVTINESVAFECRKCIKAPQCMVCNSAELLPEEEDAEEKIPAKNDVDVGLEDVAEKEAEKEASADEEKAVGQAMADVADGDKAADKAAGEEEEPLHIQFRCIRCNQSVHYEHLPDPFPESGNGGESLATIAQYYQRPTIEKGDAWTCHQCRDWKWKIDIIIAWRPFPAEAKEEDTDRLPMWNVDLPREYLVKFVERGFRHTTWVQHPWLRTMAGGKLRNFLEKGPTLDLVTDETLAAKGDEMISPTIAQIMSQQDPEDEVLGGKPRLHHSAPGEAVEDEWRGAGPAPDVKAKTGLPIAWSTIDRVLDIYLTRPPERKKKGRYFKKRISSESDTGSAEYDGPDGLMPLEPDDMIPIDDWERMAGQQLAEEDADKIAGMVSWCFAKWDDLQYEQSTWDTPPPRDSELYPAYKRALRRYLGSRNVVIPILTPAECKKRDAVRFTDVVPPSTQPKCVVGGTLMPFQLEGLQWLLAKYYKCESAILADDMGLGKTVQIAALLGFLGAELIFPCLVVVPNSTITNWVREFEKWVPHIRVVPFYGDAASRKVIREYELFHKGRQGADGLKAHVVLTTYDMITGKDFKFFKNIPRWECLVVDEGQRLKSDSSLIWSNLQKLHSVHRLLLTGTPLNNNIRELFNLLNYLSPEKFNDRDALEKRFDQANLNEDLVRELHALAQPYILRRIKDDVLRLPPKVEIIVPISLTRTQVEVYKYILESNLERLESAMAERKKRAAQRAKNQPARIRGPADDLALPQGDNEAEAVPSANGHVSGVLEMGPSAAPAVSAAPEARNAGMAVGGDIDMSESGAAPFALREGDGDLGAGRPGARGDLMEI